MEKTKEELLLQVTRLEAIIDNLPFDVWMKDASSNYGYPNLVVESLTSY